MGIQENRSSSATLINFVPLLGGMYVMSEKNSNLIQEARAQSGAQQTDGFQGYGNDSASGKALAFLKEKGVNSVRLTGTLTGISYKDVPIPGKTDVIKKALVVLSDKGDDGSNENYVLSLNLASSASQMLIRKLENVKPGDEISVNMFGSYDQNEDKNSPHFGKFFSNYGAMVKLGKSFNDKEAEVKGNESRTDELKKLTETTRTKLADAGVTDKATVGQAIAQKRVEYHVVLTKELEQRFKNVLGDSPVSDIPAESGVDQVEEPFDVHDLVGSEQASEAADVRTSQQRMRG